MMKTLFFIAGVFIWFGSLAQDTARVKFAPGTLVGKYYGTYDTSAKKPDLRKNTQAAANISVEQPANNQLEPTGLSNKKPLQVNQNFNPIEVSGTKQATGLQIQHAAESGTKSTAVSGPKPLQVNQNYDPIEVSGTERASQIDVSGDQPPIINRMAISETKPQVERNFTPMPVSPIKDQVSYRETRLGSSSPDYNTYRTNDNGAGAITTNPHKTGGSMLFPANAATSPAETGQSVNFYRDTRLGSSSPMYDTYEKNDYGAGGVTTNWQKGSGSFLPSETTGESAAPPLSQRTPGIYRDTRLGSSSEQYDTYEKNDYGAGAVTTNPNKSGGGVFFPPETTQELAAPPPAQRTPDIRRDTRLGSSSEQYNTYRKNDYGAGSVTTNPNKSGGGAFFPPETTQELAAPPPAQRTPDIRRDTRLGSSSEQYDTYRKNDYGAGSVTTNPNKSGGGFIPPSEAAPAPSGRPAYQKPVKQPVNPNTRLGSSSPQYNTYRANNNGAGSITTNPNKAGGATLPVIQSTRPEQAPQDSIPVPDPMKRNMEKRNN